MTDVVSKEKRSQIMSRIRSSGTQPERRLQAIVQQILGSGYLMKSNVRGLPGQPDVLIPAMKLAIFADGCFYHGCPKHGHIPKSRVNYWAPKLARTKRRDVRRRRRLRTLGYRVWRFWEHDFKRSSIERVYRILTRRLKNRGCPVNSSST